MKMQIDYSLYLVTDRGLSCGRSLVEVVAAAIEGGVSCVQLREKNCSTRTFIEEAMALQNLLRPKSIPLIINDRIDVAMAVGADGVHLGQDDMPLGDARRILGEQVIIGISVESVADARRAAAGGADYLGVSPVFATPTKTDTAEPLGLEGLRAIRKTVDLPLVAIGGVNVQNCASVIAAGADGLAVVSAIVSAPSPQKAAEELCNVAGLQSKRIR
ncbi:thiamine phosphate synthase [Desulforhopalus sp. IMCC35007]|uniref:thiamine phosphate synthase n=1 Tax=Desulforhopalus sp. IMCC35007 TaxID=2569543 RepID=UPI0010AEA10E|nr:thiamine phosphate synthase [Desulforhopalus sp. IMCC35007]TKB06943.1 thiamine phosphate synthase [Desulforhopalus sp. IMCC35007]